MKMNKKLKDAADSLRLHAESRLRLCDFSADIRLLVNAVYAASCDNCKGTGKAGAANADCKKCKCYRCDL